MGGEGDSAGVGDVELEGLAGGERGGERDDGFVQLAGVVGVGVDGGDVEGDVVSLAVGGGDANALPVERGGDLEGDAGERGLAVVADGEQGANGDLLVGREKMDVEIEGGHGDGTSVGPTARYPLARNSLRWQMFLPVVRRDCAFGAGLRWWSGRLSSVEREKMTVPWWGWVGWAAGC